MAPTKRRPLHTNLGIGPTGGSFRSRVNMNFRPAGVQEDRGGTKPTTTPSSIGLVLVTMLIHLCKKSLLFNTRLKVAIYLVSIFTISLLADFMPMSKTYFSRSDNILNRYFVKWGWGWLLTVTIPWVALTAHTIGCGRRSILVKHLLRLFIATLAWFVWVKTFNLIETYHGRCLNSRDPELQTKVRCLQAGKFWSGFDISGHTFILLYSNLILAEEGFAFIGWEGIKDWIVREEHCRSSSEAISNPLRNLSNDDLEFLKKAHTVFTPYLRGLFVIMTFQQLLWDVMLVSTLLYYHIMVEKFIGGIIAILTWYVTYRWWYKLSLAGMMAPGEGLFKYNEIKEPQNTSTARSRRNTLNGSVPKFMGMPIRTQQPDDESKNLKPETEVIST